MKQPLTTGIRFSCKLLVFLSLGCSTTVGGEAGDGSGTTGSGSGAAGSGVTAGTTTGAGGASGSGGGGAVGGGAPITLDGMPIYSRFVRLTHEQWEHSVRDVLRLPDVTGLSSSFASDPPDGTFSNNERALYVTPTLRGDYLRAIESLSGSIVSDPTALSRLTGGITDPATFISDFGRRAYRRPLTADELARYQTLFDQGATLIASGDPFADGVQLMIDTMLYSIHFIYRTELGTDGAPLSGYEVASKLSFLLRDTTPDDTLLDAAQAGALDTPEGLRAEAERMLEATPAQEALRRFHSELFGIDRYLTIDKNTTVFPQYSTALNPDILHADELFFDAIFSQGQGLRELLTSTTAYVNSATAPFYGVTVAGTDFQAVDVGPDRPGLLTRLGFLAYNGTLRDPDPIHRGVAINNEILCAKLAPPPNTDIPPLPAQMEGQTNRERVTAHTGTGTCGETCHGVYINPLGFAFEDFDAMGQMRELDNGKPVDTSGEYPFADGTKAFFGAPELMALLAESPQAHACYTEHLTEFGLNRDLAEGDRSLVNQLVSASMTPGSSVKQMMLDIIQSPAFRIRSGGAL